MPKRSMVILAMLPIAILLIPPSTWSQRLGVAATMAVTLVVWFLFMRWVRWHDARGAARHVARLSSGR